jgi:hypothetical protein
MRRVRRDRDNPDYLVAGVDFHDEMSDKWVVPTAESLFRQAERAG